MLKRVKIERDEEGFSASLPQEIVDRLGLDEAGELSVVETDRGLLLTRDEGIRETMTLFDRVRQKFDQAFKELAK